MKVNILVVDDNKNILRMVKARLTKLGHKIEVARNGAVAIKMLKSKIFDLILLDQQMPDMDGLTTLQEIREKVDPYLPVIMVTASSSLNLAVMFMKSGGTDFIEKPIDFDILSVKIERAVKATEQLRHEIAERQQAEEILRQSNRELYERNEDLDAFARTVAHDLKGPLALLIGYGDILANSYMALSKSEIDTYTSALVRNGQKMSKVIDELLLFSSIRKEDVVHHPLQMDVVVDQTIQRLNYMIEKYEANVILPNSFQSVIGYGPWIEEVWYNYMTNAIKYGGNPPIIEIGSEPLGGYVKFWIRDNGQGLTQDEQQKLFEPFVQLKSQSFKGHGLGLSIVKKIVEKLNGQVGIESDVGGGSLFYFTLPSALPESGE
jgi:two-component system, sensor histidine kinase and response regulator